jgi:hypothetical protein
MALERLPHGGQCAMSPHPGVLSIQSGVKHKRSREVLSSRTLETCTACTIESCDSAAGRRLERRTADHY